LKLDELLTSRKEKDLLLSKIDKQLKEKDYELEKLLCTNRRLEDEVRHLNDKLNNQEKVYQVDYDRKFEELK